MIRTVIEGLRVRLGAVPPWVALLVASAGLFLAGSASFAIAGGTDLAQVGVAGAVLAVAVIAAFL